MLTDLSGCISVHSSYDGEYLILGNATNTVLIYRLDGQYTVFQTITDSSTKVEGMPMTSDKNTIVMGGNDQHIRVYKMASGSFTLSQTFHVGVDMYQVYFDGENLILTGISPSIKFYKYDGTDLQFDSSISTGQYNISVLSLSRNLSTFSYASDNTTFHIYAKVN